MKHEIKLDIQAQPDDQSCGPACLFSLYRHYGVKDVSLRQVMAEISRLDSGGTLAEILACHALKRGFRATIYTFHLQMFDPTWFADDGLIHNAEDTISRLEEQLQVKQSDRRLKASTRAFREFLSLGGELRMEDLTPALIRSYLAEKVPIIAGLSSTYLYKEARQSDEAKDDDTTGEPQGHFVMLTGYDPEAKEVLVADPLDRNPPFHTAKYRLSMSRLINAILLGILTYDANLLIIRPPEEEEGAPPVKPQPATKKPRRPRLWKVR